MADLSPASLGDFVNSHGKELSFDQLADLAGSLCVMKVSSQSHTFYRVIRVERIVFDSDAGCRCLVYSSGYKSRRGLINECYFHSDSPFAVRVYALA